MAATVGCCRLRYISDTTKPAQIRRRSWQYLGPSTRKPEAVPLQNAEALTLYAKALLHKWVARYTLYQPESYLSVPSLGQRNGGKVSPQP
ncbi:hypothetical protein RRG08_007083 [Elysia crispata]|uniref:Uncharacterized protein n=1 Tax=Elysia crispata TaxID=231223 RepID=A0AAE0YQI8_9GAST|nr:hypothetical protein RRG08_007083 [Elysia crispata]